MWNEPSPISCQTHFQFNSIDGEELGEELSDELDEELWNEAGVFQSE